MSHLRVRPFSDFALPVFGVDPFLGFLVFRLRLLFAGIALLSPPSSWGGRGFRPTADAFGAPIPALPSLPFSVAARCALLLVAVV